VTLLITHIQQTQTSIIPDSIISTPKTPKPIVPKSNSPKSKFPTPNHPTPKCPILSDRHASLGKKILLFYRAPSHSI
jgi:hypothetical protein